MGKIIYNEVALLLPFATGMHQYKLKTNILLMVVKFRFFLMYTKAGPFLKKKHFFVL